MKSGDCASEYNENKATPIYECDPQQAAAAVKYLKALRAVHKWLVDTGCGSGLIGANVADTFSAHIKDAPPITFNTANDTAGASQQLHLVCEELGNDTVEAYLMGSSPPVLSVGKRIKRGFSIIWLTGSHHAL